MADISKSTEKNATNTVEADSTSQSVDLSDDLTSGVHKKPKTYEKRKSINYDSQNEISTITSSPCSDNSVVALTSSPQNTSRYGRARKPKITEDFYNTEDIFGPYERIPCSPVRNIKKKLTTTKLEMSPNKSNEIINIETDIIKPEINSMLSIDIPDDTIEVSKVLKIVSNNTSEEFSPKSPSFSKPVKTYGKRDKKNSESIFDIESFGLPDYPEGENCPYVNGLSPSEESSSDDDGDGDLEKKTKTCRKSVKVLNTSGETKKKVSNELVNSNSETDKRTKFHVLSLKTNAKSPVKNVIQSDNISTSTPNNKNILNNEESERKISSNSDENSVKNKLKVSPIVNNKFRVQKKPLPISRLKKVKKQKPLTLSSKKKINLGEKTTEHHDSDNSDSNSEETLQTIKDRYQAIADLQNMYMPEVGDLTWSRVGSFPFWPSIVSREPGTDRHTRSINFGKKMTLFYHVHFFGDNGRRSWVLHTHIFPFHQRSDLEIMAKSVSKDAKPKEPRHLSAFIINPTKLVKWETAVTEAESLSIISQENRMKKFFEMVASPKKISKKRDFNSPKPPNSGRISKKVKLISKKVKKTDGSNKNVFEIEDTNEESLDEMSESFARKTRKQRNKRKSSIISDDSFTDSEKLDSLIMNDARDTPSPVLSSKARHNKINLFKGISRERVCQICGKNTNVFKCKGNCYGQYHIECDRKQRLRLPAPCDDNTDFELLIGENIVGKKPMNAEELNNSNNVAASVVDEILTNVFNKVHLKQAPENNVPSLSLSEQIDLKMQEVMKNITETNYNDSTTDDSSGSDTETCSMNPSEIDLKNSPTEISNSEDNNKSNSKVAKKLIKHVTADGIFDIIEEEIELEDPLNFKCIYCSTNYKPPCFICNKDKSKTGDVKKHKCMTTQCGKFYHAECLTEWPQTKWYLSTKRKEIDSENLSCPLHNCHTCTSDDPRGPLSRMNHEKLAKCIRCPTTYHINSYCIPAGTEILSNYQIICPKHLITNYVDQTDLINSKKATKVKLMHHVNASWCFICSMGGSLICCETCPSSFHVECLKLTPPEGRYLCEECESGRLPLYDEIVWVKLGSYRWWPAQILFPAEIPDNVKNIPHNKGEFVVRFFGSHDHYWVNRGRVFLFQEGDTGHASSKKSAADRLFVKAIDEAAKAHQKFVGERANRVEDSRNSMKPPSYIKIKVNKPVGDVRSTDADTSNTTPCDCDPNWEQPCGPDSDCLNRILLTECNPVVCAAGNRCCNQAFQNREYSPVEPFKTSARGWGLRTMASVTKGTFVIEYVGEVINETEYMRRMKRKHEQKDENYYFLTIDKDRMIDAGPKGNAARFMNHSCSPNCETQKWTVNGDTRVGLFAIKDITEGAELTFNYNLECIGEEKKECRCGAPNCSGFIGVKAKQGNKSKKKKSSLDVKKKDKRKSTQIEETKTFEIIKCFVCGKSNAIQQCDREACNKFYHLDCVKLEYLQEGKWFCPWHSCNICTKRTTRCCYMCINSYCPLHSEGHIRYDRVKGFICKEHDTIEFNSKPPENTPDDRKEMKKSKKKKYIRETVKTKSIADLDLEEILKFDVLSRPSSTVERIKKRPKRRYYEGFSSEVKKKPKKVTTKSLYNLKQYKHLKLLNNVENNLGNNTSNEPINPDKVATKEQIQETKNVDTEQKIEETENDTEQKIEEKENETKQQIEENENETKEQIEENENETKQQIEEKENETKQQMEENKNETKQKIEENENETKQQIEENENDTEQKIEENENNTEQNIEKNKSDTEQKIEENENNTEQKTHESNNETEQEIEEIKNDTEQKIEEIKNDTEKKIEEIKDDTKQEIEEIKDDTKQEIEEIKNDTVQKIEEIKNDTKENIEESKNDTEHQIEKSNGLHAEIKLPTDKTDGGDKSTMRNQNNNLSIKKRKSRLSSDTDEEDVPLIKRIKLQTDDSISIENEIQNITKNMSHKTSKVKNESKSDNEEEPRKSPKVLRSKSVASLAFIISPRNKNLTKAKRNLLTVADSTSTSNEPEFEDASKSKDNQINSSSSSSTEEVVVKRSRGRPRKYFPVTPDDSKKDTSKKNKRGRPRKYFPSPIDEQKEKVVLKRGRPRKILPAPIIIGDDKETSSAPTDLVNSSDNVSASENSILMEENNTKKSDAAEAENSELTNDSQSSEEASTTTTTTTDSKDQTTESCEENDAEYFHTIDFECDAEEEITKTVINKETLDVLCVNADPKSEKNPNNLSVETLDDKSNKWKNKQNRRNKLMSPRPGIRKSSRISDPLEISNSNISNSELEISIELNNSAELDEYIIETPELNSTLIEEQKNKPVRSKSPMKKKYFLNAGLRKSNRINKTSDTSLESKLNESQKSEEKEKEKDPKLKITQSRKSSRLQNENETETETDENESTEESIDASNKTETEESSTSLDNENVSVISGEDTPKRKRGRPRIYFDLPILDPSLPKKPAGRPKKTKPIEEPKPNVEEATELYKMKLNSSDTKPKVPYDTHVNEIKLTTNVPERHLRVMLRKSEMESKAESKFLKMQNDIERDLPIRKRSKLRYEAHL